MARSNLKWLGPTGVHAAAPMAPAPSLEGAPAVSDYLELAVRLGRAQFMDACPFFFLLGRNEGPGAASEAGGPAASPRALSHLARSGPADRRAALSVLPVRKVQATFQSMVTVGRTDNNDIVVRDPSISKFHAFFRTRGGQVELTDAGSCNGTHVGSRLLDPKGEAVPVRSGEVVRFGPLEYALLDAGACWDRLRFHPEW